MRLLRQQPGVDPQARESGEIRSTGEKPMSAPELTESQQADFDERAAILEFDAGYSRAEAERLALAMVLSDAKA
jgi:hypothetical protein|tara:strand:- start:2295 stop:2516 length:222 start_codon:yes stop_codon:yes gene_type:complete